MLTTSVTAENSSWLLTKELFEPEARRDNAARIAQAIAHLMDPEWRKFVDQEQREKRRVASSSLAEA
jgi:hypothetical protein